MKLIHYIHLKSILKIELYDYTFASFMFERIKEGIWMGIQIPFSYLIRLNIMALKMKLTTNLITSAGRKELLAL